MNEKFFTNYNSYSNLFILTVNIRSLEQNFEKLLIHLQLLKQKPDIIVCTESWNIVNIFEYSIENYKIYYNESTLNQNDGVVVYINKEISEVTKIKIVNDFKFLNSVIYTHNTEIKITYVYRCFALSKAEFTDVFGRYLTINNNTQHHIITGDFNFDILKPDFQGELLINTLLSKGFEPYITGITRPNISDLTQGSCIDNFFIKSSSLNFISSKLLCPFNDHLNIFLKCDFDSIEKKENSKPTKINFNKISDKLKSKNWSELYKIQDPELASRFFINELKKHIESSTEKIKSKKNIPRKKWITPAIIISCNTKEKLYKDWNSDKSNLTKKKKYFSYCKYLNKLIKLAKEKWEKKEVKKNKNNPNKLWNFVNNKIKDTNSRSTTPTKLIDDKLNTLKDDFSIAEEFNKFFINVGERINTNTDIPTINETLIEQVKPKHFNNNSIFIKPTNNFEICQIISRMGNKRGGVDGIHSNILKFNRNYLAPPLTYIFNLCIETSTWPEYLKSAEVFPLFKKGDKFIAENYRPISLISNIAKIFEKIIHKRLMSFINLHKLIHEYQLGFLKNKGTKDAFAYTTDFIYGEINKGNCVLTTFLDFQKAFDLVPHDILLNKLHNFGIRGKALELLSSYLSNRTQYVIINNVKSTTGKIKKGVPQGTILGPLLFLIYINDILDILPSGDILSYADDTAVFSSSNNWNQAKLDMNLKLEKINIWLIYNRLSLNINKTVYITFGCYKNSLPNHLDISIGGHSINRVYSTKYLGVIFDSCLNWKEHVDLMHKKLRYLLFVFYKLKKIMSFKSILTIYYGLFHSVISYGIISWGGAYSNVLRSIVKLQKTLINLICKNQPNKTRPRTIDKLFQQESLLYHYKVLTNRYSLITSYTRNRTLRNINIKRKIYEKNSTFVATNLFNKLPTNLKTLKLPTYRLKKMLGKWISDN